jgi:LemA protein
MFGIIFLVLLVVIAVVLVGMYNSLVQLRVRCDSAWSDIDVQLKRRHDLIPNLIETVKGYPGHERTVFDEVTRARADAIAAGAEPPADRATAENNLSGALRSLFAVAEAYPQLQAVQEFKDLSSNLTATEDTLQYARRYYNAQVRDYNTAIATFPGVALAPLLGFSPYQFFELEDQADRELPQVKLPGPPP